MPCRVFPNRDGTGRSSPNEVGGARSELMDEKQITDKANPSRDSGEASGDSRPPKEVKVRRGLGRRVGVMALIVMAGLMLGIAIAVLALIGRPVVMPEWARVQIEAQVNAQVDAVQIGMGEVALVVEEGWQPRVHLRDVRLRDAEGRHVLNLSDVESTFALRPLLSGEFRPSHFWLTGMQLLLRRDVDGQVGLSLGEMPGAARQAADLAGLADQVDAMLELPFLSDFETLTADGLTLRYEDARAGRAWTFDGGRIEIARPGGGAGEELSLRGDFALLGGRDYAATVEVSYRGRLDSPEAVFGVSFEDLATSDIAEQSAALLWLNVLRAPISGSLRASTDEEGNLGPLSATLRIGEGVLQPTETTRPIPFRAAQTYFTYDPHSRIMHLDQVSVDSAWGQARGDGQVMVGAPTDADVIAGGNWPSEFVAQIRLAEISANPDDLFAAPVSVSNASADLRLRLDPFQLSLGEMTVQDGARRLVLSGDLRAPAEGWDFSLNGRLNHLTPERLLELWPERVIPRTRKWVGDNVLAAKLRNVQIGLRGEPDAAPDLYLGLEFDEAATRFSKTMPPVQGARGHANLMRNEFTVRAEAGHVTAPQGGRVEIAGTAFHIPDVREREGLGVVDLHTKSTITGALSLLDIEPLGLLRKAGQVVTMADGQAEATGRLSFPRKPDVPVEDISYDIAAELRNVRSETLIPGHVLAAPVLDVRADAGGLQISGAGRVGQVPVEGRFSSPLGEGGQGGSTVEGSIELSQTFVDQFNVGLPPDAVRGRARGDVAIRLQRDRPAHFTLGSDLAGVSLRIPQIGWSMSEAATGRLQVTGQLGAPTEISAIALDAPGLSASGRLDLGPEGVFRAASFDRVRAGNWLDAPVTLIGRGPGRAPEIRVDGGAVDLRQTEIGSGTGAGRQNGGGPIRATLDRLTISDAIALTGFRGEFSTEGGLDGSFTGRVNGGAEVTGRVIPRSGRSAFRILSEDAGGVLKSAGLLKNARGGNFDLTLVPAAEAGDFDGTLKIGNIRLREAPAMAELLNAISVVGLLEQLSGNGILFTDVNAQFRLAPDQVTLLRSSAVGASLGISMDGYYYFDSGTMQFQGVLSPLYLLNAVGQILTRRGEGLIGFNFRLLGTPEDPRVRVNPFSLLTPGMFREIFRRPVPEVTQ